jgi:hypothetical protein
VTVIASIALAWLTWRFVEQPTRAHAFASLAARARLKAYVGSALAGLAVLSVLGVLTARDQLFSERQRKMIAFTGYANYETPLPGYGHCFMEVEEDFHHFATECTQTSDPSRSVLVWGDSFARQLYPGLHEYFHATDIHILRLNASSCPPVLGINLKNRPHCHDINEFVIHEIERVKPKVVLLEAVWADVYGLPGFFDKLDKTIARLERAGVQRIFVAGQLPMWTDRLPHVLEREFIDKGQPVPARTFLALRKSILDVDGVLAQHLAVSHVRFLPLTSPVCDGQGCLVSVSDHLATDLLAYDDGHLTAPGSIYVTEEAIGPAIGAAFAY